MSGMGGGMFQGLQQGLQQRLVLTPELRMAIRILGMDSQELEGLLSEQALENPLLEYEVKDTETEVSLEAAAEKAGEPDWTEYFVSRSDLGIPGQGSVNRQPVDGPGPMETAGLPSGYEHLLEQVRGIPDITRVQAAMVGRLILSLDTDGYLRAGLSELADEWDLPLEGLEGALRVVQSLEPKGVGARDLRECLLLQLGDADGTGLAGAVIRHHLDDLAEGRFKAVCQALRCTREELRDAVARIKGLNPKPGLMSGLSREDGVGYVRPDVYVHRNGRGFVCTFNESVNPRVWVNREYASMLSNAPGGDVGDYVRRKTADAVRLARNIEQRRITVLRVAESLVRRQGDFMRRGLRFLRPMTLRDIADELGLHESTVSRAVSGKYISTPHGLFEMRFFFTSGVTTAFGESTSSESVKKRIGELIRGEDPSNPLTDDALATALKAEGTNISRRTVAKYREGMGVLPGSKRRVL